ncbi:unnamed protein product [Clonostachys rosea]|uniref:Chromo shadow domain-containing protein n=1 Tax=Bionectria ochroleuca TaxID=29856 RepID=A0ABY6V2J5_BIOOC|nr:unnamed protein product [Clonostachys rosea]
MNFLRRTREIGRQGKHGKDGYAPRYADRLTGYTNRRRYSYSSDEDSPRAPHSSTFGTIISPSDKKGYATYSSKNCPCRCCPHESRSSASAIASRRRCGSGRPGHREDPKDDRPPESSSYGPRSTYQGLAGGRREPTNTHEVPSGRHRLINDIRGGASSSGKRRSRADQGTWTINVVDRTDKSRGRHHDQYGGRLIPLSLSRDASATEIMDRLAHDRRRNKVVVHWKDGARENFDEYVPVRDAREYASHLEVKRRKNVHWI